MAQADSRIRVLVQERREGKASAINLFMRDARSPLLVLAGGDLILEAGTIDALLRHFADEEVGMVGAHPVPVNDDSSFLGWAVHLQWRLHDRIARTAPKLGELIAFRHLVSSIPVDTAVDEVSLQSLIEAAGYRLVYEPEAIVYNRGPATVTDFVRQRRRIHAGHLQVRRQAGYAASTMNPRRVAGALVGTRVLTSWKAPGWAVGAAALEVWGRTLGRYDYLRGRSHQAWQVIGSTKAGIAEGAAGDNRRTMLVFRLAGAQRYRLELGSRVFRLLQASLLSQLRRGLSCADQVAPLESGEIVAQLAADPREAERLASELIQTIEAAPLHVNGAGLVTVKLACGVFGFSTSGEAVAIAVPNRLVLKGPAANELETSRLPHPRVEGLVPYGHPVHAASESHDQRELPLQLTLQDVQRVAAAE